MIMKMEMMTSALATMENVFVPLAVLWRSKMHLMRKRCSHAKEQEWGSSHSQLQKSEKNLSLIIVFLAISWKVHQVQERQSAVESWESSEISLKLDLCSNSSGDWHFDFPFARRRNYFLFQSICTQYYDSLWKIHMTLSLLTSLPI